MTIHKTVLFQKVFETEWFSIEATSEKFPNNKPYYRLSCADSVIMLAITEEQKIILVRQFRPALGVHTLEFPAGYVDQGEPTIDAVKREFYEETGFVCKSVTPMGSYKLAPSRINNNLHFFFGEAIKTKHEKKTSRQIEVVLVAEDELKQLIIKEQLLEVAGAAIYLSVKLRGLL